MSPMWTCGRCGADFRGPDEKWAHERNVHGENPPDEPRWPASAPEKPLGRDRPAPEAEDVRSGRKGAFGEMETPEARVEDAHPTGLRKDRKPKNPKGRPPS